MHRMFFTFFQALLKSIACDQFRVVPRLDGAWGKNEVRRPIFETKIFPEQMYCIEESTCDIVGTFRRPQWFGARGICPPRYPLDQLPLSIADYWTKICHSKAIRYN